MMIIKSYVGLAEDDLESSKLITMNYFFPPQISGTAAKLGQPNAYHHCTLLINSNKANLGGSLTREQV